jgi:hypothetical protein
MREYDSSRLGQVIHKVNSGLTNFMRWSQGAVRPRAGGGLINHVPTGHSYGR